MFWGQAQNTATMEEKFSKRSLPRCYEQDQLTVAVRELLRFSKKSNQSSFTAYSLPPISSSWHQATWGSRIEIFKLNPCDHSPYVTSFLPRGCVCLYEYASPFIKRTYCPYGTLLNILSFCTTYKSSASTGFVKQIMSILRIFCYNGSLVTWTIASLTAAKFKHLIFSISGFVLSYMANMFILMTLYDFCLLLALQFYEAGVYR
jgi:hypothetical protein